MVALDEWMRSNCVHIFVVNDCLLFVLQLACRLLVMGVDRVVPLLLLFSLIKLVAYENKGRKEGRKEICIMNIHN